MAACCPPRLAVYTSDEAFLLQPPGAEWGCLSVDRGTGAVTLRGALSDAERRALPAPVSAAALLGVLPLGGGCAALALAARRERAATLARGAPLWRVAACRVLVSPPGGAGLGAAQAQYAALLRLALQEPGLYYSDAADATRPEQDAAEPGDGAAQQPKALAEGADARFFWNAALAAPVLSCAGAAAFVAPLFCGFAAEAPAGDGLTAALLARRHVGRPGRRLWARGCDAAGAAANCVATEQVLRSADGGVACHVSVRGSVPLLWSQQPDLRPKPRIRLAPPGSPGWAASLAAFRAHMASLRTSYGGPVAALSLLRHRGREAPLADAFAAAAAEASQPGDAHIAFDFNARAGAAPAGRAALLALLRPHLARAGVFCRPGAGGVTWRQRGVLRVNCLDVLDRTNMAQAAAAACAAAMQLAALRGAAQAAPPAEAPAGEADGPDDAPLPAALAEALAPLWRAHGDALAQQYTRTGAQRRDRSAPPSAAAAAAIMRDCLISLRRYVQNNHGDAAACDAAALLSGAHAPGRDAAAPHPFPRGPGPRAAHAARRAPLLQAALLLCAARAAAALRGLAALSGDLAGGSAAFALWAAAATALGHLAMRHGAAFVARPLFALDAQAQR